MSEAPPKPELNLTVLISDRGYTLATSGAVLYRGFVLSPEGIAQTSSELPTLPLVGGQYDLAGLTRTLQQIKQRYPEEERAIVTATPQVSYELLVQTMDAMRMAEGKLLFPGVLLGAGGELMGQQVSNREARKAIHRCRSKRKPRRLTS